MALPPAGPDIIIPGFIPPPERERPRRKRIKEGVNGPIRTAGSAARAESLSLLPGS